MKRTFTVTVEGEDAHKRWFDADTIREHVEGFTDTQVTVTETTAVHAKEREVIEAALDYEWTYFKNDQWKRTVRAAKILDKARELRALMEGKA